MCVCVCVCVCVCITNHLLSYVSVEGKHSLQDWSAEMDNMILINMIIIRTDNL